MIEKKIKFSRYLVYTFYAAAMIALVSYSWIEQTQATRGDNTPLYRNLRACPAYIKKGFGPSDLRKIPDEGAGSEPIGEWRRFQTSSLHVTDSSLELPKRKYLSPWGNAPQEFTINVLLEMDGRALTFLNGSISVVPGIFIAGIGENWEIYFNGKLVRAQMPPDETGRIKKHRTWYNVYFPLDASLVLPGTNILSLRILGDPTYLGMAELALREDMPQQAHEHILTINNTLNPVPRSRYPVIQNPDPQTPIPIIPGVDTAKGIVMTGGTVTAYTRVLSLFCKDAQDRLPLLQKTPEADAMSAFITQVHALKSALASLGAEKISAEAAELEAAGKTGDTTFISKHLPAFARQLAALVKNIQDALETDEPKNQEALDSPLPIPHSLLPLFNELADALKSQKISEIKRILNTLNQQTPDSRLKEILERISDHVLMTEFDNALKIVKEVLRT